MAAEGGARGLPKGFASMSHGEFCKATFGTLGTVVLEFSRGRKRKLILTARMDVAVEFADAVRRAAAEVWREENKFVPVPEGLVLAASSKAAEEAVVAGAALVLRRIRD